LPLLILQIKPRTLYTDEPKKKCKASCDTIYWARTMKVRTPATLYAVSSNVLKQKGEKTTMNRN